MHCRCNRFLCAFLRLRRIKSPEGIEMTKDETKRLRHLEQLSWLADVPLFIDDTQVGRFHDAVIRPEYQLSKVVQDLASEKSRELKGTLGLDTRGKFSLPAYLQILGLKADAEIGAKVEGELTRALTSKESETIELAKINSPERQLEDLTTYYLLHHRDRIVFSDGPLEGEVAPGKEWFHYDSGGCNKSASRYCISGSCCGNKIDTDRSRIRER
jgi:hypothetical protein